jgi:hypothetical protein
MRRALAPALSLSFLVLFASAGLAQQPKPGVSAKVPPDLAALHAAHATHRATRSELPFRDGPPFVQVTNDYVLVDALAAGSASALLADLIALGLQAGAAHDRVVSGHLPIAAIPALEHLGTLQFARPAYVATNVGLVTSQGDQAARADIARSTFGATGTGITVGVLSDSFNCLGGAATNVASNDLSAVNVVREIPSCSGATDEGRAMLQIVHDVAPGAALAFATAFTGQAGFANNITALRGAGADVIVDDVIYFAEPMFQDGIIAQAVNAAVAAGVPYFSSAGNSARRAYESAFQPGPALPTNNFPSAPGAPAFSGGTPHDFDPGAGVDVSQSFSLTAGGQILLTLQWDSPFFSVSGSPGAHNDLDVYVLDAAGQVVAGATANNVGGDAVEVLTFTNTTGSTAIFDLMIVKFVGANPGRLKYVLFRLDGAINEFATNSGTIYGHANAAGAEAVGAAFFGSTPAFGVSPPVLEPFSSAGPTPILFTTTGVPTFDARAQKPEITAPDGANTTFFGQDIAADADAFPNFFGTSAAAPHAAAVAALMLQVNPSLSPAAVYSALESTALNMGPVGFDNDSGFGLIRADAALASVVFTTVTITATDSTATEAGRTAGAFTVTRTGSTAAPLAVLYTVGGTAAGGSDYTALSGSVTIPAGAATATVPVTPADDDFREPGETVTITLAAGLGYAIGSPSSATVTILDDDPPAIFADVPEGHPARRRIEALYRAGVTAGCATAPLRYCPDHSVTREQMAVFLLRAKEGPTFAPPACTVATFVDVPCDSPFAPWVYELARRGITSGCAVGLYCPAAPVTREQMAVLLLATADDGPIGCAGTFVDVSCGSPFAGWIQRLVQRGITAGCAPARYCPTNNVTRAQMAIFLGITFGIPL